MDQRIVQQVIDQYGSPLYIFDKSSFVENYTNLQYAFREIYPNYQIAYSYKTNYTPEICKLVKTLGGYAEVVSDMEYFLAKKIGYDNNRIIYNGPLKGILLEEHLDNNGIVNIDNKEEAIRVIQHANKRKRIFEVGIRVNFDIGSNFISRFGVDAETEELVVLINLLSNCEYIRIIGFHCHISRSRSLDSWKNRIQKIIQLSDKYISGYPKFINLGSGMFGDLDKDFAKQFNEIVPNYKDYSRVVANEMKNHYGMLETSIQPMLITEPGTTLVSKYVYFLSTVHSIKSIREKKFALLDGSFQNIGEISQLKDVPIKIYSKNVSASYFKKIDLVGYTCLEQDIMKKDYCGKLGITDIVMFQNVGGYSIVFKPPFILPNCRFISLEPDGSFRIIKNAESFNNIFETFVF